MKHIIKDKMGLGTAPLGNMFREVPEEEALETIKTAWEQGVRYFDTAPFYGAGLAESRLGEVLSNHNRNDYLLSTKVGRVITDEIEDKEGLFEYGHKNKIIEDYSEDGALRSIQQSLERLKTDRLDYVYVHDISPDFHGDDWVTKFDTARTGAFRALNRLREEGVIKSWGLGVNRTQPIEMAMELEGTVPDLCLQATRYTIMNHGEALQKMMPTALENNIGIVAGAPYSSGVLVGGNHFEYQQAPEEIVSKAQKINELASKYQVSVKSVALQFSMAHPAVVAVIPGTTRPAHVKEDTAAAKETIPPAFWQEIRERDLVSPAAPLPTE